MANRILENLNLSGPEVSILLLDDRQITELNRQYLNRNYPTDVLSFPMRGESFTTIHPHIIGDVVISVETALRQAKKRTCSLDEELAALLIHGILHLLDYDHERSSSERQRMKRLERKLFTHVMGNRASTAIVNKKTSRHH